MPQIWYLFVGSANLKVAFIWKLNVTNICLLIMITSGSQRFLRVVPLTFFGLKWRVYSSKYGTFLVTENKNSISALRFLKRRKGIGDIMNDNFSEVMSEHNWVYAAAKTDL